MSTSIVKQNMSSEWKYASNMKMQSASKLRMMHVNMNMNDQMKNEYSRMLNIPNRIVQEHSSMTKGGEIDWLTDLYSYIRRACGQVLFTYWHGDAHNVDLQF
jgi:hypothetical protein